MEPLNAALAGLSERGQTGEQRKVELELLPSGQPREIWDARHGAAGFRQINQAQNEKLQGWIIQHLRSPGAVLDLFGGDANLSLGLSARVQSIKVVDLGVPLDQNTPRPQNLTFHRSAVLPWLKKASGGAQAAILDPPRAGLGRDFPAIERELRRLGVKEVIAVGCDVDSWVRDVSAFGGNGWKLARVAYLDFFPQTPHIECVAQLFV